MDMFDSKADLHKPVQNTVFRQLLALPLLQNSVQVTFKDAQHINRLQTLLVLPSKIEFTY